MSDVVLEPNSKLRWHQQIPLATALFIAICAAMLIVLVAYVLYWNNTNRKYDLARPGNQEDNKALSVEDIEADTTSPVDTKTAQQKLEYVKKEVKALDGLGEFNSDDLSDESIQLAPANEPSL